MSTLPMLLVLAGAVGLGALNLRNLLTGRRRVGLIATHLLLGVGGAEAMVAALHASDLPDDDPVRHTAKVALLLLATAVGTGFGGSLLSRTGYANLALVAHVCAGVSAFLLALTIGGRL